MDSVTLRVHTPRDHRGNYLVNEDLVRALLFNSDANKHLLRSEIDFSLYSVPIMANELAMLPHDYIIKQFHWEQDDKKTDYIKGRFHIPSSHYDVGYRVDVDREFVDISFSIPKYVYGHSVAQFVHNPHLHQTKVPTDKSFESVTKHWYGLFVKVIKDFFRSTFVGMEIDYHFVEIVRLDLAFNQYFRTKEEALLVAELMSNKRSKNLRGKRGRNEFRHDDHSSGFIAVQKNIYYKVYHKGTEFRTVGDSKRLLKHNRDVLKQRKEFIEQFGRESYDQINERKLYNVDALQREADLILRHELRFYSRTMSHIFKHKIFRKNDPEWNRKKMKFKELENKRLRHQRSPQDHPPLTKAEESLRSEYGKLINKRHRMFLKVTDDVEGWTVERQHDENFQPEENKYEAVHFSREMFGYMLRKFWEIIQDIQVDEFPKWEVLSAKIDSENEQTKIWNKALAKTKYGKDQLISKTAMRRAYGHIENYGSLETAYEKGLISQRTMYRMNANLKRLGYSSAMASEPIYKDIGFETYYNRILGSGYHLSKSLYNTYFVNMPNKYLYEF